MASEQGDPESEHSDAESGDGKLRILHVVPRLANSSGPTHIAIALAEAQARLGHEVKILSVTRAGEWTSLPDQSLVEVESFKQSWQFRNYCYSRAFGRAITARVAEAEVVHIHTIWTYPTWSTMRACVKQDVPFVVAPQGSFEDWALGRSRLLKWFYGALFERPLFRKAARFQALTEKEAKQCRSFGAMAPAVVIPNPVDLDMIDRVEDAGEARRHHGVNESEKVVLFLGRLFPKKGLELLAEVQKRILAERDDVTLWIAGSDAGTGYRKRIEQGIEAAGVGEKVRFIGEVYGEHKFRVLKESDVFILPSYSEGLPVAVLEAMAAGVATVITPGCNLPEVAEHDAGWVAEPDPDSLASAVLEAVSSSAESREKVQRARRLVRDKFSSDQVARRTVSAYREISAERGSNRRTAMLGVVVRAGRFLLGGGLWMTSLAITALILYLSWVPDSRMQLIKWIPEWLSAWADSGGKVETMRTGVPLVIAGLLFSLSWRVSGLRHWVLGGIAMGILLVMVAEGGQHFLPSRTADWKDIWWGAAGAFAGVVIAAAVGVIGRGLARILPTSG